jgi:hypothetical protein
MAQTRPAPEGMHTLTPNLVVRDCAKAIARDHCAAVRDPHDDTWSFAMHQKDMTDEEMPRAGEEFARRMQQSRHP